MRFDLQFFYSLKRFCSDFGITYHDKKIYIFVGPAPFLRNLAFSAHNGLPADLYSDGGGSPKDAQEKDTAGVVSAFVAMTLG